MPSISIAGLNCNVSAELSGPFAVVLDAEDPEWSDPTWLDRKVSDLLDLGCSFFVCFGVNSETIHDAIDDVVIRRGDSVEGPVLTTFHADEKLDEVVFFFLSVAMAEGRQGVVLVSDHAAWEKELRRQGAL